MFPEPTSGVRPSRKTPFLPAFSALALLTACAAPGHKLALRPSRHPSAVQEMNGLSVTLLPLDTQTVQRRASRTVNASVLAQLVSDRPVPYTVGPQDVVLVTVWDHPEITLALGQYRTDAASGNVIDEDGTLYFPYVGKLQVKGLTVPQLRAKLTAELGRTLQNPQVDVKVLAFRSQKVFVGGEVKMPAVYNITDVPFTLAEAINRAGGFTPGADDSQILLTRGNHAWVLDFPLLQTQGNQIGRIFLKDGDSLNIPGSMEAPVYLMGEVMRPGTLPLLHGNLSLAKALSDAGGISGTTADARSIYVVRQGQAANSVDVFHLDARNPTAMILADRFPLNARDIVYVDAGSAVRFSRVMNLILPTVSAVTSGATAAADVRYLRNR